MSQTDLHRYALDTPFDAGDRVVDTHDPADPAVVIDPAVGRADVVTVDGTDTTVATFPGNDLYPPDDVVVRVVYEAWLDHHAPGWRDQPAVVLAEWLDDYCRDWSITPQVYDYPASRLATAGGID